MIQINDRFRLNTSDPKNIVLEEKVIIGKSIAKESKNEGKESWDTVGYYSTMKSALKSFIDKEIRYSGSLEEMVERIIKVEKMIDDLLSIKSLDQ